MKKSPRVAALAQRRQSSMTETMGTDGLPTPKAAAGFTLLEIMIASAILTLGLVGILALFPVAIKAARQVIDDSNAVVVAQSVAESVRESIRNRKRIVLSRSGTTYTHFVFQHDGVTDRLPVDPTLENPAHDYYVLLPRYPENRRFRSRDDALKAAKIFVYPETSSPPNGRGDASLAANDAIDRGDLSRVSVRKVYKLGQTLPDPDADFTSPMVLPDQQIETLRQYSYALAIHPSYFDADLQEGREFLPANRLYHVRVMVFRGFVEPEPGDVDWIQPDPVYELDFEVSL